MTSHGIQLKEAGHGKRDIKKAEQHEKKVSMAGEKIFGDNVPVIMLRAIFQGYNVLDCVVYIDLCEAPPTIELQLARDFLADIERDGRESPEDFAHTKRIIERNKSNGAITFALRSLGVCSDKGETSILLKTAADPNGSWSKYQEHIRATMPKGFHVYFEDEELREEFLKGMTQT